MAATFASFALLLSFGLAEEMESFVEPSPRQLDYLLHLPPDYETKSEQQFPLVIFLHGAGERGSDLNQVATHGPPQLARSGRKFPFILVSPQCPAESWWTMQPVDQLIDHIEETLRVDPERIYLTGLSMGGYGTWHFAALDPHRFAAIAPVCGGGIPYHMRKLGHLPIWVFHGAQDSVVRLEESERLVGLLQKKGNEAVKLTVYPEAGHDSWTEAYLTDELYTWMLSHTRVPEKPQ
ncbi:MAG: prolyl oligopeptidase family serine peptidase [Verrucomicrobiota bacterium]